MYFIKSLLYGIPVGIALVLELAISTSTASPMMPQPVSVSRFTPPALKKGETEPRLASFFQAGLIHFPEVSPELKFRAYSSSPFQWTKKRPISCSRFQPTLAMSQGINSLADWDMNQPCLFEDGEEQTEYQIAPSVLAALDAEAQPQVLNRNTQLKQSNPPPPPTNPDSSAAGGRRAPSACPQDAGAATTGPALTALSPTTKPGLTLAERPTFLVYVPKTSAKNAEFSLRSREGRGVYRTTVALTNTPDIISISLPAQAPPLAVGKQYTWSLAVICNPNDRVDDQFVTSMVQRSELDPTRWSQIQQSPPKEQVSLYQKADAWYDALTVLFELQRTQPNDPSVRAMWRELLQSGGVSTMIK